MSDLSPIDDELISAYLDDEVTATERAGIEADAAAQARLAQLREVRDRVAAPVDPLSETDRERLLTRALAVSSTTPVVSSLRLARRPRAWTRKPLLAVAAAAAVVALAVPVWRSIDLGGDAGDDFAADDSAAEATTMSAAADEAGADGAARDGEADADVAPDAAVEMPAEEEPAAEPAEESAAEPAEEPADDSAGATSTDAGFEPLLPELGEFATVDQLVDRVLSDFGQWLDDPAAANQRSFGLTESEPAACADVFEPAPDSGDQRNDTATATVGATPQVIWLFDDGVVYVAPSDSCSPTTRSDYFNR
jgi:hypothetical protein